MSQASTQVKLYFLLLILLVPALTVSVKHSKHRKQQGQENIIINDPETVADTIYHSIKFEDYHYAIDRNQSCTPPNCGIQTHTNQTEVNEIIAITYEYGVDVLTHCNGDAATDQFIVVVREARTRFLNVERIPRMVVIHSQTLTEDQLDLMAELDMTPSFFPAHTFYWGDGHISTFLGPERAKRISPSRSAINRKMRYTLHNDAGITPLLPYGAFEIMWTAINRKTKKNLTLGEQQRITPYEALKGVTIHAAWQAREDEHKGSIEAGKDADLIIVSDNLLTTPEYLIKEITVLHTIKDGAVLFTHENITDYFPIPQPTSQTIPKDREQLRRM